MFRGIQVKLTVIALILVIVPLLILGFFLFDLSQRKISEEIRKSVEYRLEQSILNEEKMLKEAERLAGRLSTDKDLIEALRIEGDTITSSWNIYRKILFLYSALTDPVISSDIGAIYLYDRKSGTVYASECWGNRNYFTGDVNEYFEDAMNHTTWFAAESLKVDTKMPPFYSIAYAKLIDNRFILLIHVGAAEYQKLISESMLSLKGVAVLCGAGGTPLPGQDLSLLKDRSIGDLERDSSWVVIGRASRAYPWQYVAIQAADVLIAPQIGALERALAAAMLILSLISIPFVWLLGRSIHHPVKVILDAMSSVEHGDMSAHIEGSRSDEFGLIYTRFNYMVEQMNELIDRLYKRRIEQQAAEIRALQAQIKPHFLYNTLDTVHWMARMNRTKEIGEMIFSLCRFYRLVLSEGKDVVPVSEALNLAREYLKIQQLRYNDRFTSSFEIDEALTNIPVPKLLFQPLAENAVLHGIDSKQAARTIRITGTADEDYAIFSVWDDGMGIPPEQLTRLREDLSKDEEGNLFALRNLYNQLRFLMRGDIDMSIDSEYGSWTCITLKFPLEGAKEVRGDV
jgi:signal transduction histidine kinase